MPGGTKEDAVEEMRLEGSRAVARDTRAPGRRADSNETHASDRGRSGAARLPFVEIYTDGACSPNPGVGGWGVILISWAHAGARKELSGAEPSATNNRMELLAAIEGLRALTRRCRVRLSTDSEYLQRAFADGRIARWQARGWKNAKGKAVANVDLWRELLRLTDEHEIEWSWVRAHVGHPENTRADALAVEARRQLAGVCAGRRARWPSRGGDGEPDH